MTGNEGKSKWTIYGCKEFKILFHENGYTFFQKTTSVETIIENVHAEIVAIESNIMTINWRNVNVKY